MGKQTNRPERVVVDVAPFAPVRGAFSYLCEGEGDGAALVGCRVVVPFGGRSVLGVVVAEGDETERERLLAVKEIIDDEPVFSAELIELLRWAARYYLASEGELLRAALPPALTSKTVRALRPTALGREALDAQKMVLRRAELSLDAKQEALLVAVAARRSMPAGARRLAGERATLRQLLAKGMLEWQVERKEARAKTDLLLEAPPAPEGEELLGRAPRQRALLEQIWAAGGRVLYGDLEDRPPQARELLRKLQRKGLVAATEVEVTRDPFSEAEVPVDPRHRLNAAQQVAYDALEAALGRGFAGFLLHGVTGSGKTEVYLQLIARVLEADAGAIVLVPEIALTPQLAGRFRARFGDKVAVLHSGLSEGQRYDQWRQIKSGARPIVVGARSAIFAPVRRLGVVIVDEEHDGSFKQEEGSRYNARDIALVRAKRCGALALLGSATPSLESWHGAHSGRLRYLSLPGRATPRPLPEVEVINLRQHRAVLAGILSAKLAAAIDDVLAAGEQAILFLNRRGYSPMVHCRACGHVYRCEHCSVSLTHHRRHHRLVCHYCGYNEAPPESCAKCGSESVDARGFGTEQVERVLAERFTNARVGRLDRDTASGRGLQQMLRRMQRREVDILVGTQMVTKGHDFPGVTLVGVICADHGLHFPDFRAAERTFQLLTQVAGRAGRGERAGRVIVQTYTPEHPAVLCAQRHDFAAFCQQEAEARRSLHYPPFSHLSVVHVDGLEPAMVEEAALRLAASLSEPASVAGVDLLGPVEAPLQRIKGRTRWMLLCKARRRHDLRKINELVTQSSPSGTGVRVTLDIDPLQML